MFCSRPMKVRIASYVSMAFPISDRSADDCLLKSRHHLEHALVVDSPAHENLSTAADDKFDAVAYVQFAGLAEPPLESPIHNPLDVLPGAWDFKHPFLFPSREVYMIGFCHIFS